MLHYGHGKPRWKFQLMALISRSRSLLARRPGVRSFIVAAAGLLLVAATASADAFTFSVIPSNGDIQGAPGSVIGWGYSITNDSSTDYVETEAVNAGIFQHATLDSGDYFDFPLVAPDTTVTVDFTVADGSGFGTGLAALTWDVDAPAGFTNSGNFDLSACWANSAGTCIAAAPDALVPYSASVSAAATIPEPSSAGMMALAAFVFSAGVLISRIRRNLRG